jgi:hypothetical protein
MDLKYNLFVFQGLEYVNVWVRERERERKRERASQMSRQMNPQIAMKICFYQNSTTLPAAGNNVQSFNNFSKRAS